ncbi:endonuclease/exonuclease/phosphatase family protein [Streptomyces clavuligerus]|uniref:Endonuclease/exonuclease/phosphatase domain-containing protein n=1 Tax=Streptomyces clavuligerus TaxID=1901 RepID=B5GW29_STRCL|nr:endonuclease/exonuclease/phosphatase family protein [Streptomyces clavuligerus]EDY50525.1 hypothetical protein SSCG_03672 [Streptomyces clavuligerus]EFG03572.1 endonuclease/exonuclease/phosphatase domain-containing protein [Streptomyces clavuligerus]QCS09599.1 endonuclease [Streptomyces clavuligerus]WDN56320.1 endonuclease/exonuclease/phosphatase family protein [Streptomyces clavuligerus]
MTDGQQLLRAGTWNILRGGLGPDGSENRLHEQTEILATLHPDVLALQECSYGDHQGERRLLGLADALGMTPVAMEPSRVGDGLNFTTLLYRPGALRLVDRRRPAAQFFHHALIRARFRPVDAEDDSRDFLVLATHLSHAGGTARLAEVSSWLTDHAGDFPGAPRRSILMGDLNCSDFHDPDPDWNSEPPTLYARYRLVNEDGIFRPHGPPRDQNAPGIRRGGGPADSARRRTGGHSRPLVPQRVNSWKTWPRDSSTRTPPPRAKTQRARPARRGRPRQGARPLRPSRGRAAPDAGARSRVRAHRPGHRHRPGRRDIRGSCAPLPEPTAPSAGGRSPGRAHCGATAVPC